MKKRILNRMPISWHYLKRLSWVDAPGAGIYVE